MAEHPVPHVTIRLIAENLQCGLHSVGAAFAAALLRMQRPFVGPNPKLERVTNG